MLSKYNEIRARKARGEEGFTLIELLVVVVIIGILIAIAIPVYLNYQKSSHDKATASDVRNAIVAAENCFTSSQKYPATTSTAVTGSYDISTPCGTDQVIKLSDGTQFKFTNTSDASFSICAFNSKGSLDSYRYDSTSGGQVTEDSTTKSCGTPAT